MQAVNTFSKKATQQFKLLRKGSIHSLVTSLYKNALSACELDEHDERKIEKAKVRTISDLHDIRSDFYGGGDRIGVPSRVENLMKELLIIDDLLVILVANIQRFDFEAQKDIVKIFTYLMRRGNQASITNYVLENPQLYDGLVDGCHKVPVALHCGTMLRSCVKHKDLCAVFLRSNHFTDFFDLVQHPHFAVATDAFRTFRLLLSKHKSIVSNFLDKNYEKVLLTHYTRLLVSKNYATRRQSIKLLGELLLERDNYNIMMRYIDNTDNLKLIMTSLQEKSKMIQFEAFHVFKIFVANPNKSPEIVKILDMNFDKISRFLEQFQKGKEDEECLREKKTLLNHLKKLRKDQVQSSSSSSSVSSEALSFSDSDQEEKVSRSSSRSTSTGSISISTSEKTSPRNINKDPQT